MFILKRYLFNFKFVSLLEIKKEKLRTLKKGSSSKRYQPNREPIPESSSSSSSSLAEGEEGFEGAV